MKNFYIFLVLIILTSSIFLILKNSPKTEQQTLGDSDVKKPYVTKIRSFIPSSCGFTLAWPDTIAEKEGLKWEYTETQESSQSIKANMLFDYTGLTATCKENVNNLNLENYAATFDDSYKQQNLQKWGKVTVLPLNNDKETIFIAITPRTNETTNLVVFRLVESNVERLQTDLKAIISSLRPQKALAPLIISDYK